MLAARVLTARAALWRLVRLLAGSGFAGKGEWLRMFRSLFLLGAGMGWRVWVKGMAAAVIGGSAGALAAALSAPDVFTMTRQGAVRLLKVSLVAAVLNAAAYLKKSPLPVSGCE